MDGCLPIRQPEQRAKTKAIAFRGEAPFVTRPPYMNLEYFTPSARLDCEDGRTLLIELGDPYCSNDGQWVTSKFYSYGLTRRRHHTVWSRVFGSTRLDPFEWNLFLEGLRILVQEISTPSPRIGFRRKRASPGSIRCHHVPNCRRSPSLRTRFTDSIYRPRNGQR
jgi:hypothetical protein